MIYTYVIYSNNNKVELDMKFFYHLEVCDLYLEETEVDGLEECDEVIEGGGDMISLLMSSSSSSTFLSCSTSSTTIGASTFPAVLS